MNASDSDQVFNDKIDQADIIWIGYVPVTSLSSTKIAKLQQTVYDKKKFFFTDNDNYSGYSFPGTGTFADMTFGYYGYGTSMANVIGR